MATVYSVQRISWSRPRRQAVNEPFDRPQHGIEKRLLAAEDPGHEDAREPPGLVNLSGQKHTVTKKTSKIWNQPFAVMVRTFSGLSRSYSSRTVMRPAGSL
jgi:hypothetical protein